MLTAIGANMAIRVQMGIACYSIENRAISAHSLGEKMPIIPADVLVRTIESQQQRIRELEYENARLKAAIQGDLDDSYFEELMDFVDECLDLDADLSLLPVIASILEH